MTHSDDGATSDAPSASEAAAVIQIPPEALLLSVIVGSAVAAATGLASARYSAVITERAHAKKDLAKTRKAVRGLLRTAAGWMLASGASDSELEAIRAAWRALAAAESVESTPPE